MVALDVLAEWPVIESFALVRASNACREEPGLSACYDNNVR